MNIEKKPLLHSLLNGIIGVVLWYFTFYLLGLPSPMTHGLVTGSLIVLGGCISLSKGIVSLFFVFFIPPSAAKQI